MYIHRITYSSPSHSHGHSFYMYFYALWSQLLTTKRDAMIVTKRNAPHAHCARIVDGQRQEPIGNDALEVVAPTELAAATATRHCQRREAVGKK